MTKQTHSIDFSTVLGAAVHDMKNSLSLLRQTMDELAKSISSENIQATDLLATAHYESTRLNTGLVQLLSLYRADLENLPINVDECFVEDIVEELLANNEAYIRHKDKRLTVEVQEHLSCFVDADLIHLLLNDMLVNATRYSHSRIALSCYRQHEYFVFQIEDDGPGYPEHMLKATETDMQNFDISQGRTGLGLFFARMIAIAHSNDDLPGIIELENNGSLGGSVFRLKLP